MMKPWPLLHAQNLTKIFAGLCALDRYELELQPGEIVGVIGPNGAGKTTAFNLLTGFLRPTHGSITFQGRSITHNSADQIARLGIARTFQNIRLFRRLSVLENVLVAVQLHDPNADRFPPWQLLTTLCSLPNFRRREQTLRAAAMEWLDLFGLNAAADLPAESLAYGDQRRLEMARAMATRPALLLLDEPAAGMNTSETDALIQLIRSLRDRFGVTIVLVEHDMRLVMQLCERIQVLNYGRLIAGGSPAQISADPAVIEAYLGEETAHA